MTTETPLLHTQSSSLRLSFSKRNPHLEILRGVQKRDEAISPGTGQQETCRVHCHTVQSSWSQIPGVNWLLGAPDVPADEASKRVTGEQLLTLQEGVSYQLWCSGTNLQIRNDIIAGALVASICLYT